MNTQPLSSSDIKKLKGLIDQHYTSYSFDIFPTIVVSGVLWAMYYLASKESWSIEWVFFSFAFVASIMLPLSYAHFRFLTKNFRTDLRLLKKELVEEVVNEVGTRTYGYTIPFTRGYVHRTTYKSFKFFIQAGAYLYLADDEKKLTEFKEGESVIIEVATNSQHVLNIRKA